MTVEVPEYGGCLWPVDTACFTDEWETFSPEVQDRALALASSTLQRLTGNRVGNCPITVRPCSMGCDSTRRGYLPYYGSGVSWTPLNWAGAWINGCGCGSACGCTTLQEVALPAPVGRIDSVRVDGVTVPTTAYRLDGHLLVNLSGTPWPATQDLSLPDTEPGTFSVTYLNAYPVDSLGAYAVGMLAMEYGRACAGSGQCRLPSGVTSIVRQGVTMEIEGGAFPGGFTGLREVDTYIALWNPSGLKRQATVWSPDLVRPRVTGGGA